MRRPLSIVLLLAAGCAAPPGPPARPLPTGQRHATDRALDLAVDGVGYFIVRTPAGGYLFTRHGELVVSADGQVVNADGYALYPACSVPSGPGAVSVSPDGVITFAADAPAGPTEIGKIVLARFADAAKLDRDGEYNLPTAASGDPVRGRPGVGGFGTIVTGTLED